MADNDLNSDEKAPCTSNTCPIRRFVIDGHIDMNQGEIDQHILDYHPRLVSIFQEAKTIINNIFPTREGCLLCQTNYDHYDYKKYYLNCGHSFCFSCLQKRNNCPTCKKDFSLQVQKKIEGEECMICGYIINMDQYHSQTEMTCCKKKMCLECAVKSLTDKKEVKLTETEGIPGLLLPENYIIKGKCPFCRSIPTNKEEIFTLWSFLPKRDSYC